MFPNQTSATSGSMGGGIPPRPGSWETGPTDPGPQAGAASTLAPGAGVRGVDQLPAEAGMLRAHQSNLFFQGVTSAPAGPRTQPPPAPGAPGRRRRRSGEGRSFSVTFTQSWGFLCCIYGRGPRPKVSRGQARAPRQAPLGAAAPGLGAVGSAPAPARGPPRSEAWPPGAAQARAPYTLLVWSAPQYLL